MNYNYEPWYQTSDINEALQIPTACIQTKKLEPDNNHKNLSSTNNKWPGDEFGFWHALLTENEQQTYEEIRTHILNNETSFHIDSVNVWSDSVSRAILALECDNPEIFWWDGEMNYQYSTNLDKGVNITLYRLYSEEETESIKEQINAEIAEFKKTVNENDTEFEKCKKAIEWIAYNTTYKQSNYDQSITSVFIDHASVCEGYAKAYSILLKSVGIKSSYITGYAYNPTTEQLERHGWNIINLCDEFGYSDPTWADSINENDLFKNVEAIDERYIFMTDNDIKEEYSFTSNDGLTDNLPYEAIPPSTQQIGTLTYHDVCIY